MWQAWNKKKIIVKLKQYIIQSSNQEVSAPHPVLDGPYIRFEVPVVTSSGICNSDAKGGI